MWNVELDLALHPEDAGITEEATKTVQVKQKKGESLNL